MALLNAPEDEQQPSPSQSPTEVPPAVVPDPEPAPEPRREYDRRLGAARMQMEIDRYFTNLKKRGDDDDEEDEDECLTPAAPLPEPEFIDPKVLRVRPDNLCDVQADRWRAWEWEMQLQRAGGCYIPSPAEVDYMTRLLTIYGEQYFNRYTDLLLEMPRQSRNIADDVRAVIASLDRPQFGLDDVAGRLVDVQKSRIRLCLNTLLLANTPVIRRVSMSPTIYERLAKPVSTDTTPARSKRRAPHTVTTQAMRRLRHAAATRAE